MGDSTIPRQKCVPTKRNIYFTGSAQFILQLKDYNFYSCDQIVMQMKASDFTEEYLNKHGFTKPIAIGDHKALGLQVPEITSFYKIFGLLQNEVKHVEVIDVELQAQYNILFSQFRDYMLRERRYSILNMISLEVSQTSFGDLIEVPAIVRNIDLQRLYWAEPRTGYIPCEPCKVEKYCLISPANSYTDFHIDFSGTSVWYHLMKGIKIFYLITPTKHNLKLFWSWLASPNRLTTFFADKVDMCFKYVLRPRETLILPTGWIHAVLTLDDSLAYGGNFLHKYNMSMQLDIFETEEESKTSNQFVFPQFKDLLWFSAKELKNELAYFNSRRDSAPPTYLVQGLTRLLKSLKKWEPSCSKIQRKFHKPLILIRGLEKELKAAKSKPVTIATVSSRQSTRIKRKRENNSIVLQSHLQSKGQKLKSSSDTDMVTSIKEIIPIASTSKETTIKSGTLKMTFLKNSTVKGMEKYSIKMPILEENIDRNPMICSNSQSIIVDEKSDIPFQNDSKKIKRRTRSTKKRRWSLNAFSSSSSNDSSDNFYGFPIYSSTNLFKLSQNTGDINSFEIDESNDQPNEDDNFNIDTKIIIDDNLNHENDVWQNPMNTIYNFTLKELQHNAESDYYLSGDEDTLFPSLLFGF